ARPPRREAGGPPPAEAHRRAGPHPGRRGRSRRRSRGAGAPPRLTMPPARLLFYFLTAGGVALAVVSWLYEPPPLWLSLALLFSYVLYVTGGVVFARFSTLADHVTAGA